MSLNETNPELLAEWDTTRNQPLTPEQVTKGSGKRVWWTCPHGHSWQAVISVRARGHGCPVCTGQLIQPGVNDLPTLHPELMAEWDDPADPVGMKSSSRYKAHWKCPKGHKWVTEVRQRAQRNHGCPVCGAKWNTSFGEQTLMFYLTRDYDRTVRNRANVKGQEADVWIPGLQTVVEHDSWRWHPDTTVKDPAWVDEGITVIHVVAGFHNKIEGNRIEYDCRHDTKRKNLAAAVKQVEDMLNITPVRPIDPKKDGARILRRCEAPSKRRQQLPISIINNGVSE